MARNRFSCKTQIALTTRSPASSKAHRVRAMASKNRFCHWAPNEIGRDKISNRRHLRFLSYNDYGLDKIIQDSLWVYGFSVELLPEAEDHVKCVLSRPGRRDILLVRYLEKEQGGCGSRKQLTSQTCFEFCSDAKI